ncbi:lysoplasmalogenase [Litorilituus lipolyticus]|uniref:Lysoplasmalogenase n=1 Tax=Litorilituus lipolyticus TaxID=2491017 RepID=A0A502KTK5_9GAMM|nr:lysoplasmalogenase [Litorilituus lipolyticus]TPH13391.1 lysoplasmalogenase [Litorilituus lipolyticus]
MTISTLKQQKVTLLFVALACTFIVSTLVKPYPFSWAVKLLPIILLIGITWQQLTQLKKQDSNLKKLSCAKYFLFGLLCSSMGDFILDYNREQWFIFGLGAFFIAHLFYLKSLSPFKNKHTTSKTTIILFAYGMFGAIMFILLKDGLGELFIPVLAYMSVLMLMALATVFSAKSNAWLIAGGISFVISDSLIGFDKFTAQLWQSQLWVMASYYFAQFALVKGYMNSITTSQDSSFK